ncbi:MAG: hypothetical protein ABI843_09540 [Dokdonella sp.]
MYAKRMRGGAVLAAWLAIAGCGKNADVDAPLAFVPADTPYVAANLDPLPDVTVQRWAQQMKVAWPLLFGSFDHVLNELQKKEPDAAITRVLRALLDELRERDSPEKWQQIGLGPKVRSAIYGVGLLPVLRIELVDVDAFRATIARIEQKTGGKLATAKIGAQDIWTFGSDAVLGMMAIEGRHFVLTAVPAGADEALRRRVLGLDRPSQTLAHSGALPELNKARGYLAYGSGWIDVRRTLTLLLDDPSVATLARSLGGQAPVFEPACRAEFDRIAANAPRLTFGYSALDANRMAFQGRLDLAPAIAQSLVRITGAPPGPSASKDALADFGFALPLLKARDFWVEQATAVAKAPLQCGVLAPLNQSFADAKAKLDQVIPPPLSDLTGLRATISRFVWAEGTAKPDVSGVVLLGSSNPAFLVNLAQVSVPGLSNVKLGADGKPVALPAGTVPADIAGDLEVHAAMSANALGIAVGKGEEARLGAAITAPAAPSGVLLDASYSGEIYALFGSLIGRFAEAMPPEQRDQLESQRKLYAFYATWFKRFDARVSVGNEGIDFRESVEFTAP